MRRFNPFFAVLLLVQLNVGVLVSYAQVGIKERAVLVSETPKPIAKLPVWALGPFGSAWAGRKCRSQKGQSSEQAAHSFMRGPRCEPGLPAFS